MRNMDEWLRAAAADQTVMPMLYYPCVRLTDHTVGETVKKGGAAAMAEVMTAAAARFPGLPCLQTALDVTIDPEAFGCCVSYADDSAPRITGTVIADEADAAGLALPGPHAGRQDDAAEAVSLAAAHAGSRPVLANILGPFTLASGLMPFHEAMTAVMKKGGMMHRLCELASDYLIARAKALREAGADGILLDEASGGVIPPRQSAAFSTDYIRRIVDAVQDEHFIIILHNCGNITRAREAIYGTGCRAFSFGNLIDLASVSDKLPDNAWLIGNMDPMLLKNAAPEEVGRAMRELRARMAGCPRFLVAPGCDCPPESSFEALDAMFES